MLGVYLSGTGNTKHCIETLIALLDDKAECIALENENIARKIRENEVLYIAYPTQFSNCPFMVRDFIHKNHDLWKGKKVFCIATMGAFSGDGAGCSARLLKKYGAEVLGGLHIHMPDSVCDSKLLKKTLEENREIVRLADDRVKRASEAIRTGKYPKDGITFGSHILGLIGQRLWFYNKTTGYSDKLKISDACVGCGKCAEACPMRNIGIVNNKAVAGGKCTMCYRCISLCPQKAITLLGKEVTEQCRFEKYNRTP